MLGFLVGVIVTSLAFVFISINQFNNLGNWAMKCYKDGGHLEQTEYGFNPAFECYKDGKIINHVN